MTGIATECGDSEIVIQKDSQCLIALIDALGHGPKAYQVACQANGIIKNHLNDNIDSIIKKLHNQLKGTNGAVAAICRLDIKTGEISYTGVGNISVKILRNNPHTFVPKDGVIGYRLPTPKIETQKLKPGDLLFLCSDGLRTTYSFNNIIPILKADVSEITRYFMDKFGKQDDDASCICLRYI